MSKHTRDPYSASELASTGQAAPTAPAPGRRTLTSTLRQAQRREAPVAREPDARVVGPAIDVAADAHGDPFGVHLAGTTADAPPAQARLDTTITTDAGSAGPTAAAASAPLAPGVRQHFEHAFGAELGSVRVGESADVGARGAVAFAQGEQIMMRPGALDPSSSGGLDLLGHELTHVLQQRAGRVDAPQGKGGFHQAPALEREADVLGARAARGQRVDVPGVEGAPVTAGRGPRQAQLAVAMHTVAGVGVAGTRVGDLDIVGRPPHETFPRDGGGVTEGDHATAWGVMRLGVVNRLRNQTLPDAVAAIAALYAEAQALPGAAADRIATLSAPRRAILAAAVAEIGAAAAAAATAIGDDNVDRTVSALQRNVSAYLTYRNSIGLTVLNRGASATGDGEAEPMQLLQYWETSWTDANAPTDAQRTSLVSAMGRTFSPEVHTHGGAGAPATMPGQLPADDQAATQAALRTQHMGSLASAYPNLTARMPHAAPVFGQPWAGGGMPGGAAAVSTGASSAVQIALGADGRITSARCEGRSAHGMGGSEGSHTSPHALFERVLTRLPGQTIAGAIVILDEVDAIFRALPGAAADRAAEMPPARVALFAQATAALVAARAAAAAGPSLTAVQDYVGALLFFRNTMGLTTAHLGGVPNNHAEQIRLGRLDAFEQQLANPHAAPVDRAQLVDAIGGLFDSGTLASYHVDVDEDDDDAVEAAEADRPLETPGRLPSETLEHVFVPLVQQHVLTVRAAYPRVFNALDPALLREVATVIQGAHIAMDPGAGGYLSAHPTPHRVTPAAPAAPAAGNGRRRGAGAPRKAKRRKYDDDDAYEDGDD